MEVARVFITANSCDAIFEALHCSRIHLSSSSATVPYTGLQHAREMVETQKHVKLWGIRIVRAAVISQPVAVQYADQ